MPDPDAAVARVDRAALFRWLALAVATIGVVALLLIAQGVGTRRSDVSGGVGSLLAVTLTNGAVYFGRLMAETPSAIVLTDVFQGVTRINQQTKQQTAQLEERRTADWHGPTDMTIPFDSILFTEAIGPQSTVGKALSATSK